jgi:GGDEF domain-containing protein
MSELKLSITILLSYIIAVMGIANIDEFQESIIDFNPEFFILMSVAVFFQLIITGNLVRAGVKITQYLIILFWLGVYGLFWIFYFGSSRPIEVQLIQLLLLLISAGLAYDVGKRIAQVDKAMDGLSASAYPNRVREIQSSREIITTEITRSRRYHHPLVVLSLRLSSWEGNGTDLKRYDSLERDMIKRFAVAKVSQILSELARSTDIILRDKEGEYVLLCPETNLKAASVLAKRIEAAVDESLNSKIEWGSAEFPDEALTFEDLLQTARGRYSRSDSKI